MTTPLEALGEETEKFLAAERRYLADLLRRREDIEHQIKHTKSNITRAEYQLETLDRVYPANSVPKHYGCP